MPNIPHDGIVFPYVDTESGIQTLVFVPPFGASMDIWREQRAHFEGLNYRVILYDQRGHGRNRGTASQGKRGEYSINLFAHDLEALMDHCALHRATLVGASLGGMVALEYASMHPDRVQNLVLVGSYAGPLLKKGKQYAVENRKMRNSFFQDHRVVRKEGITITEGKIKRYFGQPYEQLSDDEKNACDAYFKSVADMKKEEYIATDLAILYKDDQLPLLRNLGETLAIGRSSHYVHVNRTLFVTGEHDALFKDGQAEMHACVPDSRFVEIPDAGHFCWINKPKEFNEAVYNFLL